jgi:hypothetical protein
MLHIAVIASESQAVTAGVIDNSRDLQTVIADRPLRINAEQLTQVGRHLAGFLVDSVPVILIIQSVLTYLELDVSVIAGAFTAVAAPPGSIIPGHGLYRCHRTIGKLPDPEVQASLTIDVIPVVGISVLSRRFSQ